MGKPAAAPLPAETNAGDLAPQLLMKINGRWINATAWRKSHPGGAAIMDRWRDQDATDAFAALHSKEAWALLEKFKTVKPPAVQPPPPTPVTLAFRKFRAQLEADGWFERSYVWDAWGMGQVLALCAMGTALAWSYPLLAILVLGLGLQQSAWIGHDFLHRRGRANRIIGTLFGAISGFSPFWWTTKHNTHHVHTNQMGVDTDIHNDPVLHLWIPEESKDVFNRRFQHIYYHFAYSFLFVSWRIQSFQSAWQRFDKMDLLMMLFNYTWLIALPLHVSLPAIIASGFFVAEVVTATHQSEDLLDGPSYTFVEDQFRTTRDMHSDNPLMNWFWGGMETQLEHHLFPTLPKYRAHALIPLVKKFAAEHGLEYRAASAMELWRMNYQTMKKNSAPAS